MPTQDKNSFHIRGALQINSLTLNLTKAQQLPKTSTHKLKNSSSQKLIISLTQKLINPLAKKIINSLNQKLNFFIFILHYSSYFHAILAKIWDKK